jgi:hypothetical protein
MDRAEDLLVLEHVSDRPGLIVGPDAELCEIRAELPMGAQPPEVRGPEAALGGDQLAVLERQRGRLVREPERSETRRDDPALSAQGRDECSPHGRLPNAPGALRSPSSVMPLRPLSSMVASVPRGQVIRARLPAVNSSATPLDRRAIASNSTAITRPSISAVTHAANSLRLAMTDRRPHRIRPRRYRALRRDEAPRTTASGLMASVV